VVPRRPWRIPWKFGQSADPAEQPAIDAVCTGQFLPTSAHFSRLQAVNRERRPARSHLFVPFCLPCGGHWRPVRCFRVGMVSGAKFLLQASPKAPTS